jgi:fused signal recognition particle receptor
VSIFGFLKKSGSAEDAAQSPAEATAKAPAPTAPEDKRPSWKDRLRAGLSRTRATLSTPVGDLFRRTRIDDALFEELESTLLMADCGVDATQFLLAELRTRVRRDKLESGEQLRGALAEALTALLAPLERPLDLSSAKPFIIMIAGVNGSGKTTSIGKLAHHFQAQGKSVLLAAGDTFRAAAREQLVEWGRRNDVTVIAQDGGDPAAVIFDAIQAAKARGIDVVLAAPSRTIVLHGRNLAMQHAAASFGGRTPDEVYAMAEMTELLAA